VKNFRLVNTILFTLVISACGSEPSTDLQDSIVESTAISNFDPGNSVIPFPNDLLFSGSLDGTINIPVANPADFSDPQVALNALDGFSTNAPITAGFTGPILASSINGNSVRLYRVSLSTTPGGAVINPAPPGTNPVPLVFGVDYTASVSGVDRSGSTLVILPLVPLDPVSSYYVVITHGLKSSDGNPMGASGAYTFAKLTTPLQVGGVSQFPALSDANAVALEPLRLLVSTSEATITGFDTSLKGSDIIMSWSFTTQSVGTVLSAVRGAIRGGAVPATALADSGADSPLGAADIYVGSLEVPYYLSAAAGVNDPTPLGSFWQGAGGSNLTRFNTAAVATSTQTIPIMVSVPKAGGPTFPIVIYQHGITTNRATLLAVADALAAGGLAAVAIDLPMHGLTGNETNGTQAFKTAFERTFDLDLVTQNASGDITAATPDGTTDSSGRHFINLANLLNSRDNLRQAVSDLFALTYAIDNLDAGGTTFDNSRIYFLGHSLGAIVGTTFSALEPSVRDTVFAFGGGGVAKILDGSASFSASIAAGLAANGVNKGSADYESFLGAAQTVIDSGDALNYATTLTSKNEGILFFEIVGGNSSPSDLVVPNRVPDGNDTSATVAAPLAGTEPLLNLMELTQQNSDLAFGNMQVSVKFIAGSHSSLLDPTPALAVTTELQTQLATFLATDGALLDVTDASLLQAP
jgi:dienelactone hydrolase